jgi:hypothetical protein
VNDQSASITASTEILQPVEIETLLDLAITLCENGYGKEMLEE